MRYNPNQQHNVADLETAAVEAKPVIEKVEKVRFNSEGEPLFRASGIGALMVNPRAKKDKEAGVLSVTAKTFVEECWLHIKYGFSEPLNTFQIQKGHICEDDSIALMQEVYPFEGGREKNEQHFNDEFFKGTPDVILPEFIEDVKTCWTGLTFAKKKTIPKLYEAQAQVYMHLTGRKKYRLIYTFVDTPESIMTELEKSLFFKHSCDEENPSYIEDCLNLRRLHSTRGIPAIERLKIFEFDYSGAYIKDLKDRMKKARRYFSEQKLGGYIKL